MRRGVIIGKFLPLHLGHLHLIREARRRCDHLTVLVCTLTREPIPGKLRFEWMRECVDFAEVVHVEDENPQEPHEHPYFWEIWRETILSRCRPDVVFTSEEYGAPLAQTLGIIHECIDLHRLAVPISGRQIRQDPFLFWEFLPPPVKAYYAKRIVITGPESTGKSTLTVFLANSFHTVGVPEFARNYLDEKYARAPMDLICEESDMLPIAQGQLHSIEIAAKAANRVVFSDTDAIVTSVYANHYFGRCSPDLLALANTQRVDLHLLLDIDVPWVPDRQRDRPHQRQEMFDLFENALTTRSLPFVRIQGSWEQRQKSAIEAVTAVLHAPSPHAIASIPPRPAP